MDFTEEQIKKLNIQFKGIPPEEIISWVIKFGKNPVVTTNFRPYEVAILNAVIEVRKTIPESSLICPVIPTCLCFVSL